MTELCVLCTVLLGLKIYYNRSHATFPHEIERGIEGKSESGHSGLAIEPWLGFLASNSEFLPLRGVPASA